MSVASRIERHYLERFGNAHRSECGSAARTTIRRALEEKRAEPCRARRANHGGEGHGYSKTITAPYCVEASEPVSLLGRAPGSMSKLQRYGGLI